MTADLGYLVNAGFSDKWGVHNDSDNQVSILYNSTFCKIREKNDFSVISLTVVALKILIRVTVLQTH